MINGINITYEKNGTIVMKKDIADTVNIAPIGKHYPHFRFTLPDEQGQFDALISILQIAQASGDWHARADIRKALGI